MFLTVGVSGNTVLKKQRSRTAPAYFPAAWGLLIPRRVRPRDWLRSPLPGSTPFLSDCPVVYAPLASEAPRCCLPF